MQNKILVENKHGNGAVVKHPLVAKLIHQSRPFVGKSGVPFNWTQGVQREFTANIKNQFQSDSCGGQMYSRFKEIYDTVIAKLPQQEYSAKSFYALGVAVGGGMFEGIVKSQALNIGLNAESIVPSYKADGTTDEPFMTDVSFRNETIIQDALAHAGMKMVSVSVDKDSIAEAIRDYGAVCWTIHGQNNGTWESANPQFPTNNQNLWAHYMCSMASIAPDLNKIPMYQSWGVDVGDKGVQYFDEAYINSGYIVDCFTFVESATPTEQKEWTLQAMIAWLEEEAKSIIS